MKVLVVDDHQLFLDGLQHTLKRLDREVEVITESDGVAALERLEACRSFDLILVDLNMPGIDGASFLRAMAVRQFLVPTVVVSAEDNPRQIQQVLNLGALGFIPKTHSSEMLLAALNTVLAGNVYVPDDVYRRLLRLEQRRASTDTENSTTLDNGITRKQQSVLDLMAKGYSNKIIAKILYVSEHTVKSHASALFNVLGGKNRTECVLEAMRRGIISDSLPP